MKNRNNMMKIKKKITTKKKDDSRINGLTGINSSLGSDRRLVSYGLIVFTAGAYRPMMVSLAPNGPSFKR